MSSTVRPDNLRAALDAKVAAAMAQLGDLRESEQPRLTPHLNPRAIVAAFLVYARGIHTVASTFGKAQAGELQFDAWYAQWVNGLGDAERTLWRLFHGRDPELIDVDTVVAAPPAIPAAPHVPEPARKQVVRFAAHASRVASSVCHEFLQLSRRFANDFVREHARFIL